MSPAAIPPESAASTSSSAIETLGKSPVPGPPPDPDILIETLPAGAPLFHGHHRQFGPTAFNPGPRPSGRFSFFTGADGTTLVSAYYAGLTEEVTVAETLLHDVPLVGGQVTWAQRTTRVVSVVRCARDLQLAQLHGAGLRRLGVSPRQLTDTDSVDYTRTAAWAAATHAGRAEVDGLTWVSARWNSDQAVILFGDRVKTQVLNVDTTASRDFSHPSDHEWLLKKLDAIHVVALAQPPGTVG